VSTLVDKGYAGQLYTLISTCETIGALAGIPVMAALYSWGTYHGPLASGAPYYLSAVGLPPLHLCDISTDD
jgi:hypothetical protein